MKTELEMRLEELEKAMKRLEVGSPAYEHAVDDYSKLLQCKFDIDEAEKSEYWKERNADLEDKKVQHAHEENIARIEADKESKSVKRDLITIAAGTWVPFGVYMLWEKSGHIVTGKASSWIGKLFKR